MEKQIQELTDKLYHEGVERGNAQAEQIVAEAQTEANAILLKARGEADALLAAARKQADELRKNTENELRLYAGQAVEAVKSALTDVLTDRVATEAARSVADDKAFMQQLILRLVTSWGEKEQLTIETADADALRAVLAKEAKALLDAGLRIEQVNGRKHSFAVQPADGAYKIVFGEDEFAELFRDFLRPALAEMLYKKDSAHGTAQ